MISHENETKEQKRKRMAADQAAAAEAAAARAAKEKEIAAKAAAKSKEYIKNKAAAIHKKTEESANRRSSTVNAPITAPVLTAASEDHTSMPAPIQNSASADSSFVPAHMAASAESAGRADCALVLYRQAITSAFLSPEEERIGAKLAAVAKEKSELEQGRLQLQRDREILAAQAQSSWAQQQYALRTQAQMMASGLGGSGFNGFLPGGGSMLPPGGGPFPFGSPHACNSPGVYSFSAQFPNSFNSAFGSMGPQFLGGTGPLFGSPN
jgi:hypothetical protein